MSVVLHAAAPSSARCQKRNCVQEVHETSRLGSIAGMTASSESLNCVEMLPSLYFHTRRGGGGDIFCDPNLLCVRISLCETVSE